MVYLIRGEPVGTITAFALAFGVCVDLVDSQLYPPFIGFVAHRRRESRVWVSQAAVAYLKPLQR